MLNGICPKCQSTEVYTDSNVRTFVAGFNNIINKVAMKDGGPILGPPMVRFDNFLCGNCGYLERYVMDPFEREELTKHWKRVGQEPSNR